MLPREALQVQPQLAFLLVNLGIDPISLDETHYWEVWFGPIKVVKLIHGTPAKLVVISAPLRTRFAFSPIASEINRRSSGYCGVSRYQVSYRTILQAEFFGQFSLKRRFGRFSSLDLSAGKFPFAACGFLRLTSARKHLITGVEDRCDYAKSFAHVYRLCQLSNSPGIIFLDEVEVGPGFDSGDLVKRS